PGPAGVRRARGAPGADANGAKKANRSAPQVRRSIGPPHETRAPFHPFGVSLLKVFAEFRWMSRAFEPSPRKCGKANADRPISDSRPLFLPEAAGGDLAAAGRFQGLAATGGRSRLRSGGARKVVAKMARTTATKIPSGSAPVWLPIEAKISPTSPRGIIPTPMKARRTGPQAQKPAASFPATPTTVKPSARRRGRRVGGSEGVQRGTA